MIREKYDLEERTINFGKNIIRLLKTIPQNAISRPLIIQLVRSATSIGANYCEADNAESKNDFKHKIGICKKESKETQYWLLMLIEACPDQKAQLMMFHKESLELNLIFNKIIITANKNS